MSMEKEVAEKKARGLLEQLGLVGMQMPFHSHFQVGKTTGGLSACYDDKPRNYWI